jgi:excisionase family DNA binding protein
MRDRLAYSIEEAAEAANTGKTALYEALGSGELAARKRGRRTLILAADLRAWLERLPPLELKRTPNLSPAVRQGCAEPTQQNDKRPVEVPIGAERQERDLEPTRLEATFGSTLEICRTRLDISCGKNTIANSGFPQALKAFPRVSITETPRGDPTDLLKARRRDLAEGDGGMTTLQWTPPQGHADIAPSRYERIEGDGCLIVTHIGSPPLRRSVPIGCQALSPLPVAPFGGNRARASLH